MHYYKRHIGDYAKKAGHLSPLEHGVYNLIIDNYYDREEAPTLMEATRWARARTEEEKSAVLAVLDEFFTLADDRYHQKRIDEELAVYHGKAEINRQIAVEREHRKRERRGASVARTVHESCTSGQPETHDSSTPGQPNHKPLTKNQEPRTKEKTASPGDDAEIFSNVDPQVVADFKALRKQKRAPITKTAMDKIAAEAAKAGLSLEAALRVCCSRGWQGFEADWVAGKPGSANSNKFRVAHLDHSSSNEAMAASIKRHNITIPADGEIEF